MDATVKKVEPFANAVLIQLFPDGRRVVSIMCKDVEMLPALQTEAKRQLENPPA